MSERLEFRGDGVRLVGERLTASDPRGTLVFLHGGGQTRHAWGGAARQLHELGWTTLSMDARGHGESQWAPDGDYSMDAFVADLRRIVALLDDHDRPVLVGASLGGITALMAEGEGPGLARALVLVDIVPKVELDGVARIRQFMASGRDGFGSLEEVAEAVRGYARNRSRPVNLEGLRKNVRQREDGRWYWHWDPAFLPGGDEPTRITDVDRRRRAASGVEIPTLLVRGGKSDVVSRDGVKDFLELIPHARYADVAEAGHMVAGDDNAVFTHCVRDFLDAEVKASGRG